MPYRAAYGSPQTTFQSYTCIGASRKINHMCYAINTRMLNNFHYFDEQRRWRYRHVDDDKIIIQKINSHCHTVNPILIWIELLSVTSQITFCLDSMPIEFRVRQQQHARFDISIDEKKRASHTGARSYFSLATYLWWDRKDLRVCERVRARLS